MSKSTVVRFLSFHGFLLVFLAFGIYSAWTRPTTTALLYALGLALNLGLIILFVKDVHRQSISEVEKTIWSL